MAIALPAWTRVAWPAALGAPLLAGLLHRPAWIPSWHGPVRAFTLGLALVGVVAALAYGRARLRATPHVLDRRFIASVLVALGLVLGSATLAILGQLEIFPPRFRFMVAAHGTQAYVYDVGFLFPETLVGVRRGVFPTHAPLAHVRGCRAEEVRLDADGHTLRICQRRCDLRAWRCE